MEHGVDRSLVERAQGGDREAYAQLARLSSDRLFALARRMLRDADAASDALQAALVQIWRDLPNLRDPDRFDAWSYRILLRACQSDRRRAKRSVVSLSEVTIEPPVADSQLSIAVRDELERAFRTLTNDQRSVLVLAYYRDMPVEEIAETLGVSSGTVKSRLHYARQAMRAALDADARTAAREGRPA